MAFARRMFNTSGDSLNVIQTFQQYGYIETLPMMEQSVIMQYQSTLLCCSTIRYLARD